MTSPEPLPLREAMSAWADGRYRRDEVSANTHRANRSHIKRFGEHFGDNADLRSISADDIEDWLEILADDGVKPQSRNTIMGTPRLFYMWAQERDLINRNPFLGVKRAKVGKTLPRRVPDHQVQLVLDSAPFRTRVMITLVIETGMRLSELTGLRVEDWDRVNATLLLRGKGDKERHTPVVGAAHDALCAWLVDGRTAGPMWPSMRRPSDGLRSQRVAQLIVDAAESVGLHITTHQYRHTFATRWARDGKPIVGLQHQLGHESLNTTSVYVDSDVEERREHMGDRRDYTGAWSAVPVEQRRPHHHYRPRRRPARRGQGG